MAVCADDSFYVLKYNAQEAQRCLANNEGVDDDGVETAFDVVGEIAEVVKTGLWVGDCFIYTNSIHRLNYYVGGEIVTISHLDRYVHVVRSTTIIAKFMWQRILKEKTKRKNH